MKKNILLLTVALVTFSGIVQADESDTLFNPDKIIEVEIEMAPADWDFIRGQERPDDMFNCEDCLEAPFPSPFVYRMATVTIDGQTFDSVGVRKKGFIGSTSNHDKPSLKVDLEEFVDSQEVYGIEKLTLNNQDSDPSMLVSYMGYRLFRNAGMAAPRCNYARVTVNGNYIGLYSNVESYNKRFLTQNYPDNSGDLYEGTASDFREGWTGTIELKTNKSNPTPDEVFALQDALELSGDNMLSAVSAIVDIDQFLKFWAFEVLVTHGDGYTGDSNNFHFCVNPTTGLMEFIHHGIDKVLTWGPTDKDLYRKTVLPNKLYGLQSIRDKFAETMQGILDNDFIETEMLAEIDTVLALISPHVEYESMWGEPFADHVDNVRSFIQERGDAMQSLIDNMPTSTESLIGSPCGSGTNTPGDLVINELMSKNVSGTADQDGEYDDWIELYNNSASSIPLTGYYLSDTYGDLQKWKFPAGTSIGANDYLIIWADKDSLQAGLHVNFKLSAAGSEWVYLADPSAKVVDKRGLSFQRKNISFGRYPNGTGDFQFMNPTFGAENIDVVSIYKITSVPTSLFSLGQNYPNPARTITSIRYTLLVAGKVKLSVFNIFGKEVKMLVNDVKTSGVHSVVWDGRDNVGNRVSSGVYIYKLQSMDRILIRSMILSK